MKILKSMKDGGEESTVTGYWLIESKSFFSIALLKFDGLSREAYHSHAFNCFSWLLSGALFETIKQGDQFTYKQYLPNWLPFVTHRETMHKVDSIGVSWLITFRGPWSKN